MSGMAVGRSRGGAVRGGDAGLERFDAGGELVVGLEAGEPAEQGHGVTEPSLRRGDLAEVLEGDLVLGVELEDPAERLLRLLSLALVEAEPAQDHVRAGVLGVAAESGMEEVLRLGETACAAIGVCEVREDESIRVGRVQQLQPADLVAQG